MRLPLLSLALGLALTACTGSGEKTDPRIVLDNPTEQALSFSIDDKSYTLAAGERQLIELADGKHSIKVGEVATEIDKAPEDGGSIINPSAATYVIWTELYTDKEPSPMMLSTMQREIELNGQTYAGPFETTSELYIKRNDGSSFGRWKWGLDEEMPESYYTESMGSNFQFKIAKIYRATDFVKAYNKLMAE